MPRKRKSTPLNPELATLGEAIELVMRRRAIKTLTAVANASGLEVKQVSTYALGQRGPTYRNLRRLCRGLGVTPATLMLTIEELETGERPVAPIPDDLVGAATR